MRKSAGGELKRLKAAGWKVGTAKDFLGLSDQEAALVEVKFSLIGALKKSRPRASPFFQAVDRIRNVRSK